MKRVLLVISVFAVFAIMYGGIAFFTFNKMLERSAWTYSRYGLWGKSPTSLEQLCRQSRDMELVAAYLDALGDIKRHYASRLGTDAKVQESIADSIRSLVRIFDEAPMIWGNERCPVEIDYGRFSSSYDSVSGNLFSDHVRAIVIVVLIYEHKFFSEEHRSIVETFHTRIEPPFESPYRKVWERGQRNIERQRSSNET